MRLKPGELQIHRLADLPGELVVAFQGAHVALLHERRSLWDSAAVSYDFEPLPLWDALTGNEAMAIAKELTTP